MWIINYRMKCLYPILHQVVPRIVLGVVLGVVPRIVLGVVWGVVSRVVSRVVPGVVPEVVFTKMTLLATHLVRQHMYG
jgi:hypothetical protein